MRRGYNPERQKERNKKRFLNNYKEKLKNRYEISNEDWTMATEIFNKYWNPPIGFNKWVFMAGCIYYALKNNPLCPIIDKGEIMDYAAKRSYRSYKYILDKEESKTQSCYYNPLLYISEILKSMNLKESEVAIIYDQSEKIMIEVKQCIDYKHIGLSPRTISSAIIYWASKISGITITLDYIYSITNVNINSMRHALKKLLEMTNINVKHIKELNTLNIPKLAPSIHIRGS